MNTNNPAQFVQQITQIQRMERGKLSVMRQGTESTHYKHQAWENGKNVSRYIPGDQAAAVQEAIEGYHKFQELTGQYAQQVIDNTRAELAASSKKNSIVPARNPPCPRSGNPAVDGSFRGRDAYRGGCSAIGVFGSRRHLQAGHRPRNFFL